MLVKDLMSTPVYIVSPEENVARARNLMLKHRIGRIVVAEGSTPIGIVTKKDLSRRLDQAEPQWRRRPIDNIPIKHVMSESLISLYPEATPVQAAELMIENDISGLPVVKGDALIGIVTKWDMIGYYSKLDIPTMVKEIMTKEVVTVHRHHTISHILYELEENAADRAVVIEGNGMPVGIITRSNLAFTKMYGARGDLPRKDVSMTRKDSYGGLKRYRYIREVPLVAEDIMSAPLITIGSEEPAVEAAKIMVRERINGIPVLNSEIQGMVTGADIIKAIRRG